VRNDRSPFEPVIRPDPIMALQRLDGAVTTQLEYLPRIPLRGAVSLPSNPLQDKPRRGLPRACHEPHTDHAPAPSARVVPSDTSATIIKVVAELRGGRQQDCCQQND
jgi:hypothetical protein